MLHRWIFNNNISRFVFQNFVSLSLWPLGRRPRACTRGYFLLFLISLFCFQPSLAVVGSAKAVQREVAQKREVSQKVETFLADLMSATRLSESQANLKIQQILWRDCDVNRVSKNLLGYKWEQASPEQRKAFATAFTAYFATRLREYFGSNSMKGRKISIEKVKRESDGYYMVSSSFKKGRNGRLFRWKVSKDGNKIFDSLVSGVSVTSHVWNGVGDEIVRGGGHSSVDNVDMDLLIYDLQQKGFQQPQGEDGQTTETAT